MTTLTLLGAPVRGSITADQIETFPAPAGVGPVSFHTAELTALCPVTGQPDLYAMTFTYVPARRCVESKALKLYLHSFRDRGVFAEELACTLLRDLVAVADPIRATVVVQQQVRGGLTLTARANHNGGTT